MHDNSKLGAATSSVTNQWTDVKSDKRNRCDYYKL